MIIAAASWRLPSSCRRVFSLANNPNFTYCFCLRHSTILSDSSESYSPTLSHNERSWTSLYSINSSVRSFASNSATVERGDGRNDTKRKEDRQTTTTTHSAQKNRATKHHHPRKNNHHRNRNKPFISVRLINESAAKETTQLFMQLLKEKPSLRSKGTKGEQPTCTWRDAQLLLAAEQSLEFWAHRNNNRQQQRSNKQQRGGGSNELSHQLETDAQTALDLFTALHHFHTQEATLSAEDGMAVLTNGMYSHVIDALAKSPSIHHVNEADRLLRQFISLYVVENLPSTMDENEVKSTLHDLRLPLHTDNDECVLSMPIPIKWNYTDKHHFPNQVRITGVMRGHVQQLRPMETESLLHLMIQLANKSSLKFNNTFTPNEIGYATVIDGYSRVCDGENAERILQLMKGRFDESDIINGANVVAYNAAISAWARSASQTKEKLSVSKSRSDAEKAEQLLREMWSYQGELLPDVVSYSSVISAYATCLDQPFGLKRAEELLRELEGLAEQEGGDELKSSKPRGGGRHKDGFLLNSTVYNTLLQAYANVGDTTSAENLLDRMMALHTSSLKEGGGGPYRNVRPNTRSFNVVLNSWAKSGTRDAGAKASELLRRMEDMSAAYKDRFNQPDIISYNTVLAAWSKSAGHDPTSLDDKDVGKEAAYKALELLDRLERQSYRTKPDVISYNTTILAFANAVPTCESGISMAKEAEGLLIRMKDQGITPVDYSYNGVLLAWSRSSGGTSSAQHCESILRSMKNPTNISWSTVINAYAQAGGAQEAEGLLEEMEEGRSGGLPTVVYNNVIHAWSRSSDPNASKNAEAILNRLESGSNGLKLPKPEIISYRLTLNALEHTKDPDKAGRAKSVLDRLMVSLRTQNQPLSTANNQNKESIQCSYNSVLAACAYTPSNAGEQARSNAARILVETLRDMNHSVDITLGPNQESFSMFLQGCTHLFQPDSSERLLLIRSALQECCEKGLLNAKIWNKFCSVSSVEEVQSFISAIGMCDGSRFEDLPPEWSRNSDQRSRASRAK